MKWRDLYTGLKICDQEDQPSHQYTDHLGRMAAKKDFAFVAFHYVTEKDNLKACLQLDQHILMRINSIKISKRKVNSLEFVVKTVGILPPGIKHGAYKLIFYEGAMTEGKLPKEMFEEEEVPEDELLHWVEK